MGKPWPEVPLGELLRRSEDIIEIHPTERYREVTVRLWGKGVALRGEVQGDEIGAPRRFRVRAGQFILSRIDARNGALGLVPDSLDGAVVSNDFPAYNVAESRLFTPYLAWLSKTRQFVDLCRAASEGTTNRVRLQEDRFLRMSIPLPPLAEQRRIVAKVEQLAAKIDEARGLRRLCSTEAGLLQGSQIGVVFGSLLHRHRSRSLGSFEPHVTSGPRNWGKYYTPAGLRFYRAQDVGPNGEILDEAKVFIEAPDTDQGRGAFLASGDLLIVITGATVGRCSVFTENHEPGLVSQHVAICRLPKAQVDPAFVLWGLRGPQGQRQLLGQRYGQGKPGLNLTNIRRIELPFPPLSEQRRIVAYLDGLQAKVDSLKALHDKAFNGEL